jgi:hypothetical protein
MGLARLDQPLFFRELRTPSRAHFDLESCSGFDCLYCRQVAWNLIVNDGLDHASIIQEIGAVDGSERAPIRDAELDGSTCHVTVRVRIIPARALPRKCGTRQYSLLPRRAKWPRTWCSRRDR